MKCPECGSKNISYGFGVHPDEPNEKPRDLIHCNECDKFSDYPHPLAEKEYQDYKYPV